MPGASGGGGGGQKEIKAGGAYFTIWGKDLLTGTLDKIQRKAVAFSAFMQKTGKVAGVAGLALAAPLAALFKGGFDRAADIARMADEFQVPIDLMARLKHAADDAGVSVQDVMNDTEGRFDKLIDRASGVDPGSIRAAAEAQRQFSEATRALQYALLPVVEVFAPLLRQFAEFIRQNASAIQVIAMVAAGLLALSAAALATSFAISGALLVIKAVGLAIGFLVSPIGLAVAALTGLGYAFLTQTEAGQEMGAALGKMFGEMGETFRMTFGGIVDAVKAGDLELAFKILGQGVRTLWAQLLAGLAQAWNAFMQRIADTVKRNRWLTAILAGGAGAVAGAKIGALFGPQGLVLGGLVGGAGGFLGGAVAGEYADDIAGAVKVDAGGLVANANAEKGKLNGFAAQAKALTAEQQRMREYEAKKGAIAGGFGAVKGNFQTFGTARQQFGYANEAQRQTALQQRIADAAEGVDKGIGELNKRLEPK